MNDEVKQDFAELEETSARVDAVIIGDLGSAFGYDVLSRALADLDVAPEAAAMIGDDVETDVGGALRAGLAGVLVRTEKYREDAVHTSGIELTETVASVAEVPNLLRCRR